jgi:hypothetical protein
MDKQMDKQSAKHLAKIDGFQRIVGKWIKMKNPLQLASVAGFVFIGVL